MEKEFLRRFDAAVHTWDRSLLGPLEAWAAEALAHGKRVRPWLSWQMYQSLSPHPDWDYWLPVGIALEGMHTFTLVHDDVMDQSPLRRGKPTLYASYGMLPAILVGDALMIWVYEVLALLPAKQYAYCTRRLSQAALEVCIGQYYDASLAQKATAEVSQAEYLHMIRLKTGPFLGIAAELGAYLAQAPPALCGKAYRAGIELGEIFQLQDDYLDVFSEHTGKIQGNDLIEGKKTFLWLWAYQAASDQEKSFMEDPTIPGQKRKEVLLQWYHKWNLAQRAQAYIQHRIETFLATWQEPELAPLRIMVTKLLHRQK
ncbi:MAG: polyprenyl synthetase family protein [Bacteroidia bacterium]